MKLGISGFAWTSRFGNAHLDLLPAVREMGFAGFEIPMFDPGDLDLAAIRRAFEANDLECTVCAILSPGVNPISPDAEDRRAASMHLRRCIEASAEMGARLLGGPVYAPIGYLPDHRPNDDEWTWAVEAFQGVGDLLDAHQMTLSIEPVNRSETFFLRTAKEATRLCVAIDHPRVGITIDTFHANIEESSVPDAVRSAGAALKHLHASENDRGLLGAGHVDFLGIVGSLREIGYEGYLMIEGFGYSAAEKDAPGRLWADMAVSPEELARRGAEFLNLLLRGRGIDDKRQVSPRARD